MRTKCWRPCAPHDFAFCRDPRCAADRRSEGQGLRYAQAGARLAQGRARLRLRLSHARPARMACQSRPAPAARHARGGARADRRRDASRCGTRLLISNSSPSTWRSTWSGGSALRWARSSSTISFPSQRTRRCISPCCAASSTQIGYDYGDLPVHDGLWSAAQDTAHDVAARLAIVPMVLEARGLDVTPATLERVRAQGDENGVRILARILDDEIRHVAFGTKHFLRICENRQETPHKSWRNLVNLHFSGALKPPFNDSARRAAGLSRDFYIGIV